MELKSENVGEIVEEAIIDPSNSNFSIVDLSDPNVVYIKYPNGKSLPPHMLDPNLGGKF